MEITQSYARRSAAAIDGDRLRLDLSAEQSRPAVFLEAMVRESLAYARAMLALHAVVSQDARGRTRDHSAYQAWVQQRYLEEVPPELAARRSTLPALLERRDELAGRIAGLEREARALQRTVIDADYRKARARYFRWLWDHCREAWMVLDPVVSVHPDGVIFELFSLDESSYGRVTVPRDRLDLFGEVTCGTTNIDFSARLARELGRVRSYRPAWLSIGAGEVSLSTRAGEAVEKKIDLPPSWVRGFLQVQSAAAYPGTDLVLSAATVARVLSLLRRQREDRGPRSLRFLLAPGEKPVITLEPWEIRVQETEHPFRGEYRGEIRVWGRRRLFVLQDLLPHAEEVRVRLLGTGMPSYWTVFQEGHRFDLGLSGWTGNDWARSARFDRLAATAAPSAGDVAAASELLAARLRLSPAELAGSSDLSREAATAALQQLCGQGQAMYDPVTEEYRWRPLLPFPAPRDTEEDERLATARRLVTANAVRWKQRPAERASGAGRAAGEEAVTRHEATVRGERRFEVALDVDADGRVRYAQCTCSWHRREKLRKGPCAHILAAASLLSTPVLVPATGPGQGAAAGSALAGKTVVFTGALTRFTRDQAEALVQRAGGRASGTVSRETSYLVAGERAGSKLTRARALGIPVLTEAEFQALVEGEGRPA